MERFYDGDQEALFKAAHVVNPYNKPKKDSKVSYKQTKKVAFVINKISLAMSFIMSLPFMYTQKMKNRLDLM